MDQHDFDLEFVRAFNPNKFIQTLAKMYGIEIEKMSRLYADYDFISLDAYGSRETDVVVLPIEQIANKTGISKKLIRRLQNIRAIPFQLTNLDLMFLQIFRIAIADSGVLRCILSRYSQQQREELIRRPDLSSKWERWVYAVIFKKRIEYGDDNRMLNPEQRVIIESLLDDVQIIFGVPKCEKTKRRVLQIKQMVKNDRKRAQNENVPVEDLADRRGIARAELEMALGLWESPKPG